MGLIKSPALKERHMATSHPEREPSAADVEKALGGIEISKGKGRTGYSMHHREHRTKICLIWYSRFQVVIHRLSGSWLASFCLPSRNSRIFCRDASRRDVFMPRKPVKYIAQQPAIHLSCAYLMSCSPSCTGKTHGLFARLQEDLALQKFLIRLSSTVFGRHMALLLSGPPKEVCRRVTVAVSNKKIRQGSI
jgi:hypothetical protein